MADKTTLAIDLQREIERQRNQSFLQNSTELRAKQDEENARSVEILNDYSRRQQLSDNIQGLIPSPRPKMPTKQFNPASLAVVAPFLKRARKSKILKEIDSGTIYSEGNRKDPDTVEVPGITEKVKQKRSDLIKNLNNGPQELHRWQREEVPDFMSHPSRGGIFTSPNFKDPSYEGGNTREGGNVLVSKSQQLNNPLFLRRDDSEYVDGAGLRALFGDSASRYAGVKKHKREWFQSDFSKKLAKEDKYENQYYKSKKSNINRVQDKQDYKQNIDHDEFDYAIKERWLNKAARAAGYDSIVALRKNYKKPNEYNKPYEATQVVLPEKTDKKWNAYQDALKKSVTHEKKPKLTYKDPHIVNADKVEELLKGLEPGGLSMEKFLNTWKGSASGVSFQKELDKDILKRYFEMGLKDKNIKSKPGNIKAVLRNTQYDDSSSIDPEDPIAAMKVAGDLLFKTK